MEVKVGGEKSENDAPRRVDSVWICMCGISKNMPFCDGSHKKTHDEEEGKVYKYNKDGTRETVAG